MHEKEHGLTGWRLRIILKSMTENGTAAAPAPVVQRFSLAPGQILFHQGTPCEAMYILQQGQLEVLVCDSIPEGATNDQVLAASRRVVLIDRPGPIGDTGFLFNEPHAVTVRAVTEVAMSRLPVEPAAAGNILEKSPRIALEMGRMLFYRYHQTVYVLEGINGLLHILQQLSDNGALLLLHAQNEIRRVSGERGAVADAAGNPHLTRALYLWTKLKARAGQGTLEPKISWLKQDLSAHFGEQYGLLRRQTDGMMSKELVAIFETLLNTSAERFAGVIVETPEVMLHICRFLGSLMPQLNTLVSDGRRALEEHAAGLASGEMSLLAQIITAAKGERQRAPNGEITTYLTELARALWEETEGLLDKYVEVAGAPVPGLIDGRALLAELAPREEESDQPKEVAVCSYEWSGLRERIIKAAGWDDKQRDALLEQLDAFRALPNPQDVVDEAKKVRNALGKLHWQLYRDLYCKLREQKPLPPEARFYLRYGTLDERMFPAEAGQVLATLPDDPRLKEWPIYYADEWLRRVWRGKETTSLTEVGQTYEEVMADQQSGKKKQEVNIEESLIGFEIAQLLTPGTRMVSRSLAMAFPLFNQLFLGGDLKNNVLTRKRVQEAVDRIRALDYSLFHREVRVVHQGAVFFVQKEVLPSIILVPCVGDRALCWQEMEGTNKQKPGRILLPVVLREDLDKVLLEVLGKYRWELNRSCAGYNWANPAEGGLTGNYFDYACFFAKNSELSTEAKDEVRQYFKRYASTSDRFMRDYMLWMTYEKDGVLKLNKVTRKIFFKYVPFPKAVRESLNRFPAFQDLQRVDANLRTKRLMELANRIKKAERQYGKIPDFLKAEYAFYTR